MDDEGIIPVLARTVRQVEADAQHGPVRPSRRTAYQVVALLVREERARIKTDPDVTEGERTAVMARLDGIATILAKTAARDTSLLQLLAEGAVVSPAAVSLKNDLLRQAGARARAGGRARARGRRRARSRRRAGSCRRP